MPTRRPAALLTLAAGLVVIIGGVSGLLLTRHSTLPMRPVAAGVDALPAPTGRIVAPPQSPLPASSTRRSAARPAPPGLQAPSAKPTARGRKTCRLRRRVV